IVRIGGRRPTIEEVNGGAAGDLGLDWVTATGAGPCPFLNPDGRHCSLPSGPACSSPPPPTPARLPSDEYLCDRGAHGIPATVGSDGRLGGVEPRDAVVRFDIGLGDRVQPRILPTNIVCVYAPRFAEVRVSTGPNETIEVRGPKTGVSLESSQLARSQ